VPPWGCRRLVGVVLAFVGAAFLCLSAFLPLKSYEWRAVAPTDAIGVTLSAGSVVFRNVGMDNRPFAGNICVVLLIVAAVLLCAGGVAALMAAGTAATPGSRILAMRVLWVGVLAAVGVVVFVGSLMLITWIDLPDVRITDAAEFYRPGFWMLLASPVPAVGAAVLATGKTGVAQAENDDLRTWDRRRLVGAGRTNEAMLVFAALAVFPGTLVAVKAARIATTPRNRVPAVVMLSVALAIAISAIAVVAAQVVGWVDREQAAYYRSSEVTVAYAAGFWLLFVGPILVLSALLLVERTSRVPDL
jgi:hypothetical protein